MCKKGEVEKRENWRKNPLILLFSNSPSSPFSLYYTSGNCLPRTKESIAKKWSRGDSLSRVQVFEELINLSFA
jgi:hypothetical protein